MRRHSSVCPRPFRRLCLCLAPLACRPRGLGSLQADAALHSSLQGVCNMTASVGQDAAGGIARRLHSLLYAQYAKCAGAWRICRPALALSAETAQGLSRAGSWGDLQAGALASPACLGSWPCTRKASAWQQLFCRGGWQRSSRLAWPRPSTRACDRGVLRSFLGWVFLAGNLHECVGPQATIQALAVHADNLLQLRT